MRYLTSSLLALDGRTNPTLVFVLLLGIVVYQLLTGSLLNLKLRIYVTRSERPEIFWTVLAIEALVSVLGIYIGIL